MAALNPMANFPYIAQIKVNNCFTYQNFVIPHTPLTALQHIVITGKNGSGKTTILNRIAFLLQQMQDGQSREGNIRNLSNLLQQHPNHESKNDWKNDLQNYSDVELLFTSSEKYFSDTKDYIFSYFKAQRKVNLKGVKTVTNEAEFNDLKAQNHTESFINLFKQYLVNKKVYEALDALNSKTETVLQTKIFFDNLTQTLRAVFEDETLLLDFVQEEFEFYVQFKDNRRVTFNQLSDGFSAFLAILMDLFMRTDLLRKSKKDYSLEPEGIVLIDEPETHFHLSMQYLILPLLTKLFPKIQLIIATHSPAIISSIQDAIVYDLTSKEEVKDQVVGSSFSELMVTHFGLDNEYSPVADKIIDDVTVAVREKNPDKLQSILVDNERFLTPSLRLEIESQIIDITSRGSRP